MDTKRRLIRVLQWFLGSAVLIALFWGIWHLSNGSVPATYEIRISESWTIILPFAISRWFDVFAGPIIVGGIAFIATSDLVPVGEDEKNGMVYAMIIAILFALIGIIVGGIAGVPVSGLIVCLIYTLVSPHLYGLNNALICGMFGSLVNVAIIGLIFGLVFGLAVLLIYGLIVGLIAWLVYGPVGKVQIN